MATQTPDTDTGQLTLGSRTYDSRLIVGTGKYASMELMRRSGLRFNIFAMRLPSLGKRFFLLVLKKSAKECNGK